LRESTPSPAVTSVPLETVPAGRVPAAGQVGVVLTLNVVAPSDQRGPTRQQSVVVSMRLPLWLTSI